MPPGPSASSSTTTNPQLPRDPNLPPPPVWVCPVCLREYDDEFLVPQSLRCGCAMCSSCLAANKDRLAKKTATAVTCAEGHPLEPGTDAVPSKLLLRLVKERQEYCPVHPSKKIEIWCPACATGLCVSCHMGEDHLKRCASIQQLEINTPQAREAVTRRAQEMLTNFAEAEMRVTNASLPPLEAYSADALMNRMRDLAVQARQAFDEKLFEIISANLELALGHQIGEAYKSMEDRHQRIVLLQQATRLIQDCETLARESPAAAAARLRKFQIDPVIGKPLTVIPGLRILEGIRLEIEPIWRDMPTETISVLENETIATLAITESENHRVKIIRTDSTFIRHLGSAGRPGTGELEFAGVRGIALLGDGQTLAIAEMENHRIKLVKIDGTFVGNIGSSNGRPGTGDLEFNGPRGVAVLGDGSTLAICDFGNHRVKIVTADGVFIRHLGCTGRPGSADNEFNKPISVAVLGDGVTLAITDLENHRVKIINSVDGRCIRHIGEVHRAGRQLRGLSDLEFNLPLGICVLGDGVTIAVCDSENHKVKIIRADDGTFVRSIGTGIPGNRNCDFHGPCGITTLTDGSTMAVTDFENHRIKIIRSDGAFIRHIGGMPPATRFGGVPSPGASPHLYGKTSVQQQNVAAKKFGKGEREFYGPWGIVCLDFHAGSPTRSGINRASMNRNDDDFNNMEERSTSQNVVVNNVNHL